MEAVIFDPQYKVTPETLSYHREQWKQFNPTIHPIPAGRAKVGWYQSKKILLEEYDANGVMLPLGLPFQESIVATCLEMKETLKSTNLTFRTVVSCIGSGTMFAGLWNGIELSTAERIGALKSIGITYNPPKIDLYGVLTRTGSVEHKKEVIQKKAMLQTDGFWKSFTNIHLIDPGWEYTQRYDAYWPLEIPFPCNPFYDAKAWEWLIRNKADLKEPILFWNIGS
jgi:hypothetical protein